MPLATCRLLFIIHACSYSSLNWSKINGLILLLNRCDCKNGYRGNGTTCYGNILQVNNIFNENTAWMLDTVRGSYLMLLNYQISNFHVFWLCNNGYVKLDWLTSLAKLSKNWGSHCQGFVFLSYIESWFLAWKLVLPLKVKCRFL